MEEVSNGALVPAVKAEAVRPLSCVPPPPAVPLSTEGSPASAAAVASSSEEEAEIDRVLTCPICIQLMKDAFLTACGHSFCYMCIVTHLRNKSDCPCCGRHLTGSQLFPNFLLDKLLKKASARSILKSASPVEQFRRALQQGCEISVKELDSLMALLVEKKRKMEQEESERNMQILFDFLHCLRKQKLDELTEVRKDLHFIKEDINAVEWRKRELYQAKDRYALKLRMLGDDSSSKSWSSSVDKSGASHSSPSYGSLGGLADRSFLRKRGDGKALITSLETQRKDALNGSDLQYISQSGLAVMRKKRLHGQFNELQECYLRKRRQSSNEQHRDPADSGAMHQESYNVGLAGFQSVLSTFTRYSRLRVIAELRHEDPFHSANIVSRHSTAVWHLHWWTCLRFMHCILLPIFDGSISLAVDIFQHRI